jgi:serine/threonine-protein kinase HipA
LFRLPTPRKPKWGASLSTGWQKTNEAYDIYLDCAEVCAKAGELIVSRGKSTHAFPTFQFTYDHDFLSLPQAFALSPDMPLIRSVFHGRSLYRDMLGAFADAMPDRWGRRLIERRTGATHLHDIDYLLNVPDFTRQGALRIKQVGATGGNVQPESADGLAAPQEAAGHGYLGVSFNYGGIGGLAATGAAIKRFMQGEATEADVEQLLFTGSQSNGGQFPKTALIDESGDLCIAKFPGNSELASPQWEALCLALAKDAGITVPSFSLHWLGDMPVLIEKRFDREPAACGQAHRVPYVSADSFMQLPSRQTFITPYSVFAQLLRESIAPEQSRLLFRRIAFLLMVNNTDDHWKNHGLLHKGGSWQLAPLFDVNPTTRRDPDDLPQLTSRMEVKRSIPTLLEDAASYSLNRKQAEAIISEVAEVVAKWRDYTEEYIHSEQEIEHRAAAFALP